MCAIITLGQESNHGMAVIKRTVEKGVHPHGLAFKFVSMLKEKHKLCDASAKITLTAELRAIPFKMASDYYNDVVSVLARYDLLVSETESIQFLAERVKTDTLATTWKVCARIFHTCKSCRR